MKLKLKQLRGDADALLAKGEVLAAMRLYTALLRRVPSDYLARLRLADTLVAAKQPRAAQEVYQRTAQLCIDAGLPLVAIVAIRAIEALEGDTSALLEQLARSYCRGSDKIAAVGARMNITYPDDLYLPAKELREEMTVGELQREAERVGAELSGIGPLPLKFPAVPILGRLSEARLLAVLEQIWVHRLPAGHVLLRRGERGTSCYLVAAGRLMVNAPDDIGTSQQLATLTMNAVVGEMALITGSPRLADVEVVEAADVLELGPDALAALGDELAQLAPALDELAQNRWMKNMLEQGALFRPFSADQRRQILQHCSAFEVPRGTTLFAQGERPKGVYLLLRGEVSIARTSAAGKAVFSTKLAAGAMIGVNAAVYDQAAAATARTDVRATVLFLSNSRVKPLLQAVPEFAEELKAVALVRDKQILEADRAAE